MFKKRNASHRAINEYKNQNASKCTSIVGLCCWNRMSPPGFVQITQSASKIALRHNISWRCSSSCSDCLYKNSKRNTQGGERLTAKAGCCGTAPVAPHPNPKTTTLNLFNCLLRYLTPLLLLIFPYCLANRKTSMTQSIYKIKNRGAAEGHSSTRKYPSSQGRALPLVESQCSERATGAWNC